MNIVQAVMVVYLGTLSYEDIRKKKINSYLLAAGSLLVLLGIIVVTELTWRERLLGGSFGIGLLLISFVTKEAIGKADCILLIYLGIISGYLQCVQIVLAAFGLCGIVCMGCMGFKVLTRKQRIPFVPFLLTGFLCSLLW